jgi:hypothetical protein
MAELDLASWAAQAVAQLKAENKIPEDATVGVTVSGQALAEPVTLEI